MNADIKYGHPRIGRTFGSRSALALVVIGACVGSCFVPYATAASNDESAIRDVMKRWDDAINTNDMPRFFSLYVQDASVVHFEENTEKPVVGFESFRKYAESDLKPEFQDHAQTTIERCSLINPSR